VSSLDSIARHSGCLGVLHIPKTGGVALRDALEQFDGCYTGPLYFDTDHFGSVGMLQAIPSPNSRSVVSSADLAELVEKHTLVIGHYSTESLTGAGCTSLAVQFREPRSRILSLYRYWQAQSESVRTDWGRWGSKVVSKADLPLKDFLTSPEVWPAVDNAIARQTVRYQPGEGRVGTSSLVSASYSNFSRRLVAAEWSSRSQDFLARICELTGISVVPVLKLTNATEVTGDEETIDRAVFNLLDQLTNLDRLLLDQLTRDGVLRRRSSADLNLEFETSASRLGFRLRR
jgi:hypothetical protein